MESGTMSLIVGISPQPLCYYLIGLCCLFVFRSLVEILLCLRCSCLSWQVQGGPMSQSYNTVNGQYTRTTPRSRPGGL